MPAFVAHPEKDEPFPGTEFRDAAGRMISLRHPDSERQEQALARMRRLEDAHLIADTGAILRFLDGEAEAQGGAAGAPASYRDELHPGAEHGYALPDRDVSDQRAANRDWKLIFAMFRRMTVEVP